MTDFQVSIAAKLVRLPHFILQHSDADGYGTFTCKITKKNLIKWILPIIFIGTVSLNNYLVVKKSQDIAENNHIIFI